MGIKDLLQVLRFCYHVIASLLYLLLDCEAPDSRDLVLFHSDAPAPSSGWHGVGARLMFIEIHLKYNWTSHL